MSRMSRKKAASSDTGIAQSRGGSPSLALDHQLETEVLGSSQHGPDSISDAAGPFLQSLTEVGSLSALSHHSTR